MWDLKMQEFEKILEDFDKLDVLVDEHYYTAAEGLSASGQTFPEDHPFQRLMNCVLILKGEMMVTGDIYCSTPDEWDLDTAKMIAKCRAAQGFLFMLDQEQQNAESIQ